MGTTDDGDALYEELVGGAAEAGPPATELEAQVSELGLDPFKHGNDPTLYALDELTVSAIEASDGLRRGTAIMLDVVGRENHTARNKGMLYVVTMDVAVELVGELLRSSQVAFGDDFERLVRNRYPLELERLRRRGGV